MTVLRALPLLLLILASSLVLPGCDAADPGTNPGGTALFEGMAAVSTGDPALPVLAVHEDGEMLGVVANPASGRVTGAIFTANDLEHEVVVQFQPDGTPERLVMGNQAVVFDNVRADRVDLVLVSADGTLQVARDVPYDLEAAREAGTAFLALASAQGGSGTIMEALRAARLGVSIVTCTVGGAMIVGAIVTTGPIGALLAGSTVAGCTSSLFTVVQEYNRRHGTDDAVISGTAEAFGNASEYINLLTCAEGDPGGCIESGLFVLEVIGENADEAEQALQSAIEQAQALLQGGGGDVQVSLTWDTTADVDLWVTDPSGERIFYGNRQSVSGGQLDVDDTNGFGPENIFWPTGAAPAGTYRVEVDHYAGASPTRYRLTTVVQGTTRTFNGTVVDNQTVNVTTFTVTGVRPGPTGPAPEVGSPAPGPKPSLGSG